LKILLPNQNQQWNVITWFLIFCKSNEFFPKKKQWSNILFSYLFFIFVQNFKPKKKSSSWHVYLNVFNHIVAFWKNYIFFLPTMGAIIIFEESIFIFSFVIMNLITKSLGLGAHLRRWQWKQNVKRWMWDFWLLQPN